MTQVSNKVAHRKAMLAVIATPLIVFTIMFLLINMPKVFLAAVGFLAVGGDMVLLYNMVFDHFKEGK